MTKGARVRHVITVTGVVQGVGFRPFVYLLAQTYHLTGWVCNTSFGVIIDAEGTDADLAAFLADLQTKHPPLAHIDQVFIEERPLNGLTTFEIRTSIDEAGAFQPISPDIAICADCLAELFDPVNRRYRYPFINCTNCGPRYTIIHDIPYDRPRTTMAYFAMCPACQREYDDPTNRRFHAQPNACPACGPHVWLVQGGKIMAQREDAIPLARDMLRQGAIIAIKGIGGFHLACDATNDDAISRLRARKGRIDKPFALMAFDAPTVMTLCYLNDQERTILESRARPIVLLKRRPGSPISSLVAPGNRSLGVMLPYTPLHYLLLEPGQGMPPALVMTSGNLSEEPIAKDNDEAMARLAGLADAFLLHNRDIAIRCDDSVVRVMAGHELPIRRSRGYAPYPVHLGRSGPSILGCGAELKNTICLTRNAYAFLSQHIGDMENQETLQAFEDTVRHLERLFRTQPAALACDLHPDYLASRYGRERATAEGLPLIEVQHHHAHIAALLAEKRAAGPVIGVAWDGTGYGPDGTIWGGEFLLADAHGYQRVGHLAYVRLPGGDTAIRRPYRTALAHLLHACGELPDVPLVDAIDATERGVIVQQIRRGLHAPLTSSMGRLFDAVAALAGVRTIVTYEGQAAMELEHLVDEDAQGAYLFSYRDEEGLVIIDPAPVIRSVVADVQGGTAASIIAGRFHRAVALMLRDVCLIMRDRYGVRDVALSGGVFQNIVLLRLADDLLRDAGFTVLTHHLVPPNDGGVALGQAWVALHRL